MNWIECDCDSVWEVSRAPQFPVDCPFVKVTLLSKVP